MQGSWPFWYYNVFVLRARVKFGIPSAQLLGRRAEYMCEN